MKKILLVISICLLGVNINAQFTTGNLVVLQVGDGTGLSSAGNPMALQEFTPAGAPGFAVNIPSTGSGQHVMSGTATSEGLISLSADQGKIIIPGYAAPAGTLSIASTSSVTFNRAIASVDALGNYAQNVLSSTAFNANNIRGAASDGLGNFWATGANLGYCYFGTGTPSTVSTTSTNNRATNIVAGNITFSTGAGTRGIYQITGTPTSGLVAATLIVPTGGTSSPFQYAADLVNGIVYIADDRTTASGGGIQKWVFSGTWNLAYTFDCGSGVGARGLVVDFSGPNPILYATTADAANNRLIKFTDAGAPSAFTLLASAPSNKLFRGVCFAPICVTPSQPGAFTAGLVNVTTGTYGVTYTIPSVAGVTYNWTYSGTGVTINGSGNSVTLDFATGATSGTLSVTVTNGCGTSISRDFAITVTPSSDFGVGNFVVLQTTGSVSKASSSITLREYTTGGTPGISVTLPNTGPNPIQTGGVYGGSEGFLTTSTDQRYLVVAGYGTANSFADITATSAASTPRVVGKVTPSAFYETVASSTTFYNLNDIRVGISDGTNFWAGGASVASVDGVDYYGPGTQAGLGTAATPPKPYGLRIFNGQIYYSTQKAGPSNTVSQLGIFALGTGLPTGGTPAITQIINTGTLIPQDFSFNPTDDVCYIAISLNNASGGIQKWTKTLGVWSLAYTLGTGASNIGAYGLIVDYSGPNPILYATTFESGGNRIIKITDMGSGSPATDIVTATAGTYYKGISFAPVDGPTPTVELSLSAVAGSEAGTTVITVTANTSSTLATSQTVSVNISGAGITGGDYTLSNATITIPALSSQGSVTFTVVDDLLEEGNETAAVSLSGPSSGITLGLITTGNILISDNDNSVPTIVMDVVTTSDYIDGGVVVAPSSPYAFSGVVGDVTDPGKTLGVYFTLADAGTPVTSLTLTAVSSNPVVVPNANLVITGTGASRSLKINPVAVGYSNITLTVSDGMNNTNYVINYAASNDLPVVDTNYTFQHTGLSDASDGVPLDTNYYITADDELDVINVYSRKNSGLPLLSYDYSSFLSLPDPANPEVDVEGATRSLTINNRVFFTGSMSNGKAPSFNTKPNRDRLFATTVTGTGASATISVVGYCAIKSPLLAWGDANGYGFTASAAAGVDSKAPDGFAAEGLVFGPDSTTLYLGLRAPLVPVATRTNAVIAPIVNFEAWFNNGSPVGSPTFGSPIELNLGGRGIRDLIKLSDGNYIIVAGNPAASPLTTAIYKWSGHPGDLPILVTIPVAAGNLNMEGAMEVVESAIPSYSKLQVISDGGGEILYADGQEAKDFGDLKLRKFRSDVLTGLDLNLCSGFTSSISAGGSTTFCTGDTVTLSASSGVSYLWSNGSTSSSIDVVSSGNYSVTVKNIYGCYTTSPVTAVTVNPLPNVGANVTDNDICAGTSVTFNGTNATSYTWNNGVTDNTPFTPASTNTYTVTGTDGNLCSNTATVTVTVNALPNVVANVTDNDICAGTSVIFNGSNATSYTWDNGVTDNVPYTPASTNTYAVTGTDGNGCSNTATVTVTVNTLPTVGATVTDNDICAGTSVTFNGTNATSYTWDNGVTDNTPFTPASTNTYTVTGTDANLCSNTATVTVTVNALPTVGATVTDNDICAGTSVTFNGTNAVSYTWDNGVTDNTSFTPASTNTYTVTGTDANLCSNTATVTVTVHNLPTVVFNLTVDSVCTTYAPVSLSGTPAGGSFSGTGVTGNSFNPNIGTGNFTITYTYTDANSCTNTDTDNLIVSGCLDIYTASADEISIYPNPTENYFYIKSTNNDIYTLNMIDINGRTVLSTVVSNADMIDVSRFASGMYQVELIKGNEIYRSKLIKK